jgi:F-box-like
MSGWELSKSHPHWRLQQSFLGSSSQGTLDILPPCKTPGKCFISALPDELLAKLLEVLAPSSCFSFWSQYGPLLPILFVCRRWRRLCEPLLYRRIVLGYNGWEKLRRTYRLLETLKQRPELAACVQETQIELHRINDTTSGAIADILRYCQSSLSKLSLHTTWESSAIWPILRAIRNCAHLEVLRLSGGPTLQIILTYLDQPVLKTLDLSRYGWSDDDGAAAPWSSASLTSLPLTWTSAETLLAAHHTKGTVTMLKLQDPRVPAHVTELLVRWPARLVSIALTALTHSKYFKHYSIQAVQRCLDYHCQSLEHVTLGILMSDTNHAPDFSHFPKLQTLQLSSYNLLREKPHVAAKKLIGAPSMLRHLSISFSTEDQHQEPSTDFGAETLHWMEDFAGRMTMEGTTSDAKTFNKLETMYVNFDPDDYICERPDPDTPDCDLPSWPWEYVDQAAQALSQLGVKMKYSSPGASKQNWFQNVKHARQEAWEERARAAAEASRKTAPFFVGAPDPKEAAVHEPPRGIERYFRRL